MGMISDVPLSRSAALRARTGRDTASSSTGGPPGCCAEGDPMPNTDALSTYSDWTYFTAVACYVLAMVLYLVEQAFSRTKAKVLVGTAGEEIPEADTREPGRAERFGRMAVSVNVLG